MVEVPKEHEWQQETVENRIDESEDATYLTNEIDKVEIRVGYTLLSKIEIYV